MYSAENGRFCSRDPIGFTQYNYSLYEAPFVYRSALDPGGNDWVWPWDPDAEWWWPFDQEDSIFDLPIEVRRFLWPICAASQSNFLECSCCGIELLDLGSGMLLGDIPGADQVLNVMDCLCDGTDIVEALCAIAHGQGVTELWVASIPFTAASCLMNAINFALSVTGVGSLPHPIDVVTVLYEAVDFTISQASPCAGTCYEACSDIGGSHYPLPPFPG